MFTTSRRRSRIQDCLRKFGRPENVSEIVSDVLGENVRHLSKTLDMSCQIRFFIFTGILPETV